MRTITPHAVPAEVTDEQLEALRERVRRTHHVADPWHGDDAKGFGASALAPLLERWAGGYDWRAHERRIRALPWRVAGSDEDSLRVIHRPATDPDAPAVVLLHGWPDSVLRFERLMPLLEDVHVIAPAMPGFPFALEREAAASVNEIADLVVGAVDDLGYDRFVLSGGDVGGNVAEIIAGAHPERVAAMHLTNVSPQHAQTVDSVRLAPEARTYLTSTSVWFRSHGGYIAEQSTRPSTLMVGLGDSPAGLAAWILEKVTAWSDDYSTSFSPDDVLTWVSAYWFTESIGTSFSTYAEPAVVPERTAVPTVVSAFPADIKPAPRSYIEEFVDLREYNVHDAGGHFAAWEQPGAYAEDLRHAVRLATS
ncbi:MAG TPA: epoxide hydrolase [Humibacter sp.]|jgi:pimeloyl-ACP methyl ester carboxylesterase|nr:epoxide hydrolase [Humibacter sp.]